MQTLPSSTPSLLPQRNHSFFLVRTLSARYSFRRLIVPPFVPRNEYPPGPSHTDLFVFFRETNNDPGLLDVGVWELGSVAKHTSRTLVPGADRAVPFWGSDFRYLFNQSIILPAASQRLAF
jgi:hypothetical protein